VKVTFFLEELTAASKTPRKKRIASAPEKFDTAAKQERMRPQIMMLKAAFAHIH